MDYREFHRQKYEVEDPWHYGTSLYEKVRHAAMVEFVLARQPRAVLDLGCGEGHFLARLLNHAPGLRATGVEVDPAAAARCRERLAERQLESGAGSFEESRVEILCADLFDFLSPAGGARNAVYDAVVCGDVLYYLPPASVARQVVPGVASLLSPGGGLVVSYADINDHAWTVDVFRTRFRLEQQVYIRPLPDPPPWPWMVALLSVG